MRESMVQLMILAIMCGIFGGLYAAESATNIQLKERIKQLEQALQEILERCKQ